MIAAPVGYRCPDCVRTEQPTQPVTVAGATAILKPYVTYTLIVANVLAFIVQLLVGVNAVAGEFGMSPVAIGWGDQWYRLATSMFLHGDYLHIGFNMLVLFILGMTLERILGHFRYAVLYIVAGLGGAIASFAFAPINSLSIGASGAVFGVMGGLIVAGRRLRYDVTQVVVLLGINVVIGFLRPGIDWRAHLGGMIIGALIAAIFVHAPHKRRTLVQASGVTGVILLLVGLALWKGAQIQEMYAPMGVPTF